jgi:hypothetical protein
MNILKEFVYRLKSYYLVDVVPGIVRVGCRGVNNINNIFIGEGKMVNLGKEKGSNI